MSESTQQTVKSNAEVIAVLKANTAKKKDSGIGYVWSTTTNSIGKVAGVVGSLATAAEVFSQQAVTQAAISRIESAQEMCEVMNIQCEGIEALTMAKALTDYIISQS